MNKIPFNIIILIIMIVGCFFVIADDILETSNIINKKVDYVKHPKIIYEDTYETCQGTQKKMICSDTPLNKTCAITDVSYNYECNLFKTPKVYYTNIDVNLTVNNITYNYEDYGKCTITNDEIICETTCDSNMNGKCESGESCKIFKTDGTEIYSKEDNKFYNSKLRVIR